MKRKDMKLSARRRALPWRIPVGLGALLATGLIANAQAEETKPTPIAGTRMITAVAFSPDGKVIASGGWDNKVTLRDASTHKATLVIDLRGSGNLLLDLAFSPDGKRIVTGSRQDGKTGNPTVKVWDTSTGVEALTLEKAPSEFCSSVAFSPDGSRIVAGCFNQKTAKRSVHLWDARTGAEVRTIDGVNGPLAFSPDSKRVTGGHGYTLELRVFDTSTGEVVSTIAGSSFKGCNRVAFRPDGSLVSGNGDGTLKLWNASTGKPEEWLRPRAELQAGA